MCKTLYNQLYELRAGYSDIYADLSTQIESGLIPMESEEGAFINLYRLIEIGIKEAISLNITSYYLLQVIYSSLDDSFEELRKLSLVIAGQVQQPF